MPEPGCACRAASVAAERAAGAGASDAAEDGLGPGCAVGDQHLQEHHAVELGTVPHAAPAVERLPL